MTYLVEPRSAHRHKLARQSRSLARTLGWFSIALGALEAAAPHRLASALGMPHRAGLLSAYGWREIGTGLGILLATDPKPFIAARIAGDVLDLATLAPALSGNNPRRRNAQAATAFVVGVTVLDIVCVKGLAASGDTTPVVRRDYRRRLGFSRPPHEMRGAARDFAVPADMRTPELLQPLAAQPPS
jgi:hypothetical protein